MNYREGLSYLQSFTDFEQIVRPDDGTRFELRRVVELLTLLGHPEERFGTFHVVGTKGKGSTAAMIAASLRASGRRVGLFTSPHLHTFRERIRVDGEYIAPETLGAMAETLRPMVDQEHEQHPEWGRLTTFEVTTALALAYFAREGIDYAVLEAGLGGRLDATNAVAPLVTVITPIGLDHTQYLGSTVMAIAREKAAVIKPGGVVVSAAQATEAREVVEEVAKMANARLFMVGRDWHHERLGGGQGIAVRGPEREYRGITVPLVGEHQIENATLAVAAVDALYLRGTAVSPEAVRQGIAAVRWPGRFEVIGDRPAIVVDGAHNPQAMRRLRETIETVFGNRRLLLVLGTSVDKDIAGIVTEIAPAADQVIVTRSRHPRSASLEQLETAIQKERAVPPEAVDRVAAALNRARELAGPGDVICVTGSLFVVAEAREAVLGREATGCDEEA